MSQNPPENSPAPSEDAVPLNYASVTPPRTGLATASLVVGIFSIPLFVLPLGFIAVISGIIALRRVRGAPTRYGGRQDATVGIVTGVIGMVLFAVLVPMAFWGFGSEQIRRLDADRMNLRHIGQGVRIYAYDNYDAFPPDLHVLQESGYVSPGQLINPKSKHRPPACDYYYVIGLAPDDPPDWIVAHSDPAHYSGEGANILYLDGHAEFVREPDFTKQLEEFFAKFEQHRGVPPVVIPPK